MKSDLLKAMLFLKPLFKKDGEIYERHAILSNNYATLNTRSLSAGYPIVEELNCCPHWETLAAALAKCGDKFSITLTKTLTISSGKFRAAIKCVSDLNQPTPHPSVGTLSQSFKAALAAVLPICKEDDETNITTSILLNGQSVVATDRALLMEIWHGVDMPVLTVSKEFARFVVNVKTPVASFGFDANGFTVWFEDRSWVRTQLLIEKWPDVGGLLSAKVDPKPVPNGMWEALDAVLPFSDDGRVRFRFGQLQSHASAETGAIFELPLELETCFSGKLLKTIQPHVKTIDFAGQNGVAYFFGDNLRGALCSVRK